MAEFIRDAAGSTEAQQQQADAYLFANTAGLANDGVLSGLGVTQTGTASVSVLIAAGAGVVQDSVGNGVKRLTNNSQKTLDVLTANPMGGTPRNDIIVFDSATSSIRAIIGTPNASPTDPTVPTTALPLARIRNLASATTIPTAQIDDLRSFTTLFGVLPVQFVRKASDQSVTSSTVLVNDTTLKFTAVAGATYEFEAVLYCDSAASSLSDIKFAWSFPTGSLAYAGTGPNNAGLSSGSLGDGEWLAVQSATSGSTSIPYALSNNQVLSVILKGTFAATASGTVNLMFAQVTSGAQASTVRANSHLKATRVI